MTAPTKAEIKKFSTLIEELATTTSIPYMEAVLKQCEETGLEPETAARLLTPVVKKKIQAEAEALNFLKKK